MLARAGSTLAALLAVIPLLLHSQELKPLWNGNELRVSAPSLHFLTGAALSRLRDGAVVTFDAQLTHSGATVTPRRVIERFLISYDLWEERYSVIRTPRDGRPRKSASHLTQAAAEAWCLDNLVLPTAGIPPEEPGRAQIDIRVPEMRRESSEGEDGLSLTTLVELFSRPARGQQQRWLVETSVFKLSSVRVK